jgi:uncharacterized protein with HEPN domain
VKDDSTYLKHILQCIERIREDTREGHDSFVSSHLQQDAVLRNLQTLSESTQHLSADLTARHPEIEWKRIAAFRNILVHDYLGIDMERIWEIVRRDLAALELATKDLLRGIEEKS